MIASGGLDLLSPPVHEGRERLRPRPPSVSFISWPSGRQKGSLIIPGPYRMDERFRLGRAQQSRRFAIRKQVSFAFVQAMCAVGWAPFLAQVGLHSASTAQLVHALSTWVQADLVH